jgi:hypothetical protein
MAKRNKSWKDQLHTLDQRRDAISELVVEYGVHDTPNLLRRMQTLREEIDLLDLQKQRLSERVEAIGQTVADRWETEGVTSMNVEGLGTFSVQTKLYVSAPDKALYHQWLRDNHLETLIQPTVAAKTTEALVRERLEEGLPCDGFGLSVHYKTIVR